MKPVKSKCINARKTGVFTFNMKDSYISLSLSFSLTNVNDILNWRWIIKANSVNLPLSFGVKKFEQYFKGILSFRNCQFV